LAQLLMRHRQKRQVRRNSLAERLSFPERNQGLRELPSAECKARQDCLMQSVRLRQGTQGFRILAGTILGRSQSGQVFTLVESQSAVRLCLAEGKAIVKGVTVTLTDAGPGCLVVPLRVLLLPIAVDQGQGLVPRLGAQRWRAAQVFEDIRLAQGLR